MVDLILHQPHPINNDRHLSTFSWDISKLTNDKYDVACGHACIANVDQAYMRTL